MKNKKYLRDLCLISSVAATALMIFAAGALLRGKGEAVEIKVDGELFAALPLSKDAEIDIDGLCVLVIENGGARIDSAVCKNQICVHHRPISRAGEAITCLPSGVTVKVSGDAGVDVII